MAYERRPGTGVLLQALNKRSEKAPDWYGDFMLANGETVKLSGWIKQSAKGALISLSEDTFKPDPSYRRSSNANPAPSKPFNMEDDIPF